MAKVVATHVMAMVVLDRGSNSSGSSTQQLIDNSMARIFVRTLTGKNMTFRVDLTGRVLNLMELIHKREGIPVTQQALIFRGRQLRLEDRGSLGDYKLSTGSVIHLVLIQRGGKPVIYLFATVSLEASVELSLVPRWSLSAIYPVTPIKSGRAGMGETVSIASTRSPGRALDRVVDWVGYRISILGSSTNPTPPSPPPSPHLIPAVIEPDDKIRSFDPSLDDGNAVVISVNEITPYLDATLKALGLHTEARTSFIAYWLPSLLKHEYIAFRFLPQASFEQSAPLRLSPTADVVTRVFMVFRGVEESELEAWPAAQKREKGDVSFWVDVVGVDVGRTVDKSLFRVIEWGGMAATCARMSPV